MPGLFLLVVVVVFTWLCVRSVRAGWGKLLWWLLCFVVGTWLMEAVDAPPPPWNAVLSNSFAVAMLALPAWWIYRAAAGTHHHSGKGER